MFTADEPKCCLCSWGMASISSKITEFSYNPIKSTPVTSLTIYLQN